MTRAKTLEGSSQKKPCCQMVLEEFANNPNELRTAFPLGLVQRGAFTARTEQRAARDVAVGWAGLMSRGVQ